MLSVNNPIILIIIMKHSVIILSLILLLSCHRTSEQVERQLLDSQFQSYIVANDSAKALPVEVKVRQWALAGDTLYVLSTERSHFLNEINLEDMSLVSSFGNIGQGPGEYIYPRLISSEFGGMFLGDAHLGIIRPINDSLKHEFIIPGDQQVQMNDAYLLNDTSLAYVALSPICTRLLVRDLTTGEDRDSLQLPVIPFPDSEMSTTDFQVGSNGEYFVVAYKGVERFDIIRQADNLRPGSTVVFQGDASPGNRKFFFFDLACGKDFFALLSMKNKDVSQAESYPDIEIYDYQGNPLTKISINFLAYRILIDENRNRLLLLSATDDDVHIINNAIHS